MKDLSGSIVVYKNDAGMLAQAIHSFLLATEDSRLFIIDNSPSDELKYLAYDPRITYIFNNRNVGFGAGHNIALKAVTDHSRYHLVLNPDVYFDDQTIRALYSFMENNNDIGHVMPKVLFPNGGLQYLCKLLPAPHTLIIRRFLSFVPSLLQRENYEYELKFANYDKIMDVPFLSGCFMFLRMDVLRKTGLFDERFFLYTEDTDLTRRIHKVARTVYFPSATIYHHHARGSYKEFKLLCCNIVSAVKYFNKWGWFSDLEREMINKNVVLRYTS